MARYGVPAVGIAVINGGRIEWARSYGLLEYGGHQEVNARTLFQAASISKPVATVAALRLVEQGLLDLDSAVNSRLLSWKIPDNDLTESAPVTIEQILTHTAGLSVSGFAGYAADEPVPTLHDVLDGRSPANSPPVRVVTRPGERWQYSGGGYCVLQLLLQETIGRRFPDVMRELVLQPAGMLDSTFEQPLPRSASSSAAAGHGRDGKPISGGWHNYPEMAAAGLWTTPTDLCRFALVLQTGLARERGSLLSCAMTERMLSRKSGDFGLGVALRGQGDRMSFLFNGGNFGYSCQLFAYARRGQGAVVMTNSDSGMSLKDEILRAIAAEYGWPDYHPAVKPAVAVTNDALKRRAGRYRGDDATVLEFAVEGGHLVARIEGATLALVAESPDRFFETEQDFTFAFTTAEGDSAASVAYSFRGRSGLARGQARPAR